MDIFKLGGTKMIKKKKTNKPQLETVKKKYWRHPKKQQSL